MVEPTWIKLVATLVFVVGIVWFVILQFKIAKPIELEAPEQLPDESEVFGILAMCDAFEEDGSMVGGERKQKLVKYLPKQIASRLMELQDLIEKSTLRD